MARIKRIRGGRSKEKLLPGYVYIIAVLLLASIMWYSYTNYYQYYPSLATFHQHPAAFDNVVSENCGTVEEVNERGFVLRGGKELVQVFTDHPRYPMYGTVCVYGTYKKEGYIIAEQVRYNDYIYLKYFLSSLSLIYVIYIFNKEWKLTKRGFAEQKDA